MEARQPGTGHAISADLRNCTTDGVSWSHVAAAVPKACVLCHQQSSLCDGLLLLEVQRARAWRVGFGCERMQQDFHVLKACVLAIECRTLSDPAVLMAL